VQNTYIYIYIYYMLLVYITEYACTKAFPEKNSVTGVVKWLRRDASVASFVSSKIVNMDVLFMACVQLKCQDMDTEV